MKSIRALVLAASLLLALPAVARDAGPTAAAHVDVGGEVAKPLHLSAEDLAKLPRARVHASAHGTEGDWEGVALIELMHAAGAPIGEALRGANLRLYLRIDAADGYHAVFALAEIDPGIGGAQAILADRRDDKPLAADEGPLRIIVPGDKRPARWVRQVTAIELLKAPG